MCNYEYSLEDFLEFEKNENLFQRKYKNVYYWQSLRAEIVTLISHINIRSTKKNTNKTAKVKKYILNSIKNRNVIRNMKECDILYFCERLYREIGNDYVDIYFDFFDFDKYYSITTCYYIPSRINNDVKDKPNCFAVELPEFVREVLYTVFKSITIDRDEELYLLKLAEDINKNFDSTIDGNCLIRRVKDVYFTHLVYERYYSKILRKLHPKVIFLDCYYCSLNLFPLYVVAKRFGIPVIEYMHGNVCNSVAYTYTDISTVGKELPDYFFSYGEFWNGYIKMPECVKIKTIGNPFLEKRKDEVNNVSRRENGIVFYSSETMDIMIEFLESEYATDYHICYKPHPLDDFDNAVEKLSMYDVQIYHKDDEIYEVINRNKFHISSNSTVLYEALAFDVKCFVYYDDRFTPLVQPLLDNGYAQGFSTVIELAQLLCKKDDASNAVSIDNIWKDNATCNANNELKKIIDNRKNNVG